MHEGNSLEGRVALVTGGTHGIGLETARALARAGAKVAFCGRSEEAAGALAQITGESRGESAYYACDVSDARATDAMIASVVERWGKLEIVVSNAGIAIDGLLLRTTRESWDAMLGVNLSGAFNVCKAASRHLIRTRDVGRIVFVSSVVGDRGNAGQAAYAATKAGLLGLMRSLAQELGSRGVTVNAVSPGFIETRMTEGKMTGDARATLLAQIPLGRVGTPVDVAAAVRFLCSPEAAYITGQVLRVNGGMYM